MLMRLFFCCFVTAWIADLTATNSRGQSDFATQFVQSKEGIVVSDTPLASEIGTDVLMAGGNAVDSAIAVAFALAVTWPEAGNIGGGGFMMIAPPDAEVQCIEYREKAPLRASEDMFVGKTNYSPMLTVGVPGTVAGLKLAHERYGSLPWQRLIEPSIKLAEDGFKVDAWLAQSTNEGIDLPSDPAYEEIKRVYAPPNGSQWREGDTMRLPDLARTLKAIAESDGKAFYQGDLAQSIEDAMRKFGGIIDKQDLLAYSAVMREPVRGSYKGFDIYGAPLPSSGGICTVLALNMLETLELDKSNRSSTNIHLLTEALRRTFWQRAEYLGDSDFVSIPPELTSKAYAKALASTIDPKHATPSAELASHKALTTEGNNTTHFSVIDRNGFSVSNTYTLESAWGANVIVPNTGIILNDEMNDFNKQPGVSDERGKIGTAANLIKPGKRMLSSQAPTIVKKDGKVVIVTGSPGGRTIISTVVQVLLNRCEFQLSPQACIGGARIHHQWYPDKLNLEKTDDEDFSKMVTELESMGHKCSWENYQQGTANSIFIESSVTGVADLRRGSRAIAVEK